MFRSFCCDCIATIQPSIPTTSLGLALLPICSVCCCISATIMHQPVVLSDSELTSSSPVVLTDWLPSLSTPSSLRSLSMPFQLRALHDPLRDYSPPILPLCIQYIQPTYRVCTLHDPRRLWKVRDSNPRCARLHHICGYRCFRPLSQPSFLQCLAILSQG